MVVTWFPLQVGIVKGVGGSPVAVEGDLPGGKTGETACSASYWSGWGRFRWRSRVWGQG